MSSPLAIAVVSAVIMDLLNDALIDNDLSPLGSVRVSALPPDRLQTGAQETNQLNLFLYRVSANAGWRNVGLPSHDARGAQLTNPPLALDLHYLLSAYGSNDLNAEVLLGYAMELLHDLRVIPRQAIRHALASTTIPVGLIPADLQGRFPGDLADQIELIKITPQYLGADELSKLWTAMQSRYRPSVAYEATVVLIQGLRPAKSPLPVLTRGKEDSGPVAHGSLAAPFPTVTSATVRDPSQRTRLAAQLGDLIVLKGFNLTGATATALFRHRARKMPLERPVTLVAGGGEATVALPPASSVEAADWLAGTYGVALQLVTPDRTTVTSEVGLSIAPSIVSPLPMTVARDASGTAVVTITISPPLHPTQQATVIVGGEGHDAPAIAAATDTLTVTIAHAEPTPVAVPLRVRVDGLESVLIPDAAAAPPRFDPRQSITIT